MSEFPEREQVGPEAEAEGPPAEELPQRFLVRLPGGRPYVVWGLLVITISVYLLQMASTQGLVDLGAWRCPYFFSPDLPVCYGLKVNEFIIGGQFWRLLSPILLHGSLLHIGFNMYALYILGPDLERHFGHLPFLGLYLTSGFAGFVISFILTDAASLGASTAIFGLLGAQGVLIYRNRHIFGRRAQVALRSLINIAVINFLIGLSPGIDNWGHFGGMLGGLLFSGIAAPYYAVRGEAPEFDLEDQQPYGRALLAALATALLFAVLAVIPFLSFM